MSDDKRTSVLRFVERSLATLVERIDTLDKDTTFAISLFLAGAADRYAVTSKLNNIQRFILISETVGALDIRSDAVDDFTQRFTDHSRNPKFATLIDAGRRVMDLYLAQEPECFNDLPELISDWLHLHAGSENDAPGITIMITDLIDLNATPEDRRLHNAIVRTELAKTHGEEIGHTGDGIIASFGTPLAAVRAGIRIRHAVRKNNDEKPDHAQSLRIGIHTGETLSGDDPASNPTVKLAATICVKAGDGDILISQAVHDLCEGQDIALKAAGDQLYRVLV